MNRCSDPGVGSFRIRWPRRSGCETRFTVCSSRGFLHVDDPIAVVQSVDLFRFTCGHDAVLNVGTEEVGFALSRTPNAAAGARDESHEVALVELVTSGLTKLFACAVGTDDLDVV